MSHHRWNLPTNRNRDAATVVSVADAMNHGCGIVNGCRMVAYNGSAMIRNHGRVHSAHNDWVVPMMANVMMRPSSLSSGKSTSPKRISIVSKDE